MPRGRTGDLRHIQTPPEARGALWWLAEHAEAERAVTLASRTLDGIADHRAHGLWSRVLDERMDWLETVDDTCDRITDALRSSAAPWVAEAVAAHYLRPSRLPWRDVAEGLHMDAGELAGRVYRALDALAW